MKETIWPEAEYNKKCQGFKKAVNENEICTECQHFDAEIYFEGDVNIDAICTIGKFRCYFNTVCDKFKLGENQNGS